jgi:hypothetical protein
VLQAVLVAPDRRRDLHRGPRDEGRDRVSQSQHSGTGSERVRAVRAAVLSTLSTLKEPLERKGHFFEAAIASRLKRKQLHCAASFLAR